MSSEASMSPPRSWSVATFGSSWADPDLARAPGVRAVITDDIVGYWPRPIGVVRGAAAYYKVIESVLTAGPRFSLAIGEHAWTGEFTFIRWIATVADKDDTVQFNGCDRVRTRMGLVCENYVFCDHPFFETVARRLSQIG